MLYFDLEADWKKFNKIREEIAKLKEALSDIGISPNMAADLSKQLESLETELDSIVQKAAIAGDAYMRGFANKITGGNKELEQYGVLLDSTAAKLDKLSDSQSKEGSKFNSSRYEQLSSATAKAAEEVERNVSSAMQSLLQLSSGLEDEAGATKAEIERLNDALAAYEKSAAKAAVSGDKLGLDVASMQIANIKQAIAEGEQNLTSIEKAKEAISEQTAALGENMKQAVIAANEFKKLQTQIEEVTAQMKELEAADRANSEEYAQLQQKLDTLSGSYEQAAENVSKFNQNASDLPSTKEEFASFNDEVKEGADAISKLSGSSEGMLGLLSKISGIMKTTTKLQGVANTQAVDGAKKQSRLANALSLVSSNLIGSITGVRRLSTAMRALTATISATPLVIITALLAVLAKLASKWRETREEQNKFYKETAQAAAKPIASYKKLQTEFNSLDFEGKERFIKQNAKAFDELGMSIKNVADAERMLNELDKEFINLQILKAKSEALRSAAMEKINKAAEKNIKQQTKSEDQQWGNAEHAVEVLQRRIKIAAATGNFGGVVAYTKQLAEAKKAAEEGREFWLAEDEWVNKRLEKQQKKLGEEAQKRNDAAQKAEDEYKKLAKELGIDTGELVVDSTAYYKEQISLLNKELEKNTDKTGKTAEEIKRRIQEYQNEIDRLSGAALEKEQKLADELEKNELDNQKRRIALQKQGIQKQLNLLDVEYMQKKAEYEKQKRDLAKQYDEGKISGSEFYQRDDMIEANWGVTQQELRKKREDAFKAEAERQQRFQDELYKMQSDAQKRNLELQENGIEKQLALIDLEYDAKIKEYERQERELQKQLKEGSITQAEYEKKSTMIGYQKEFVAGWEADKQKTDVIDSMLNNYKDYTQKKLDIDKKYEKDKADLEAVIQSEKASAEQKEQAERAKVKLEQDRNKAQMDLGLEELKNGGEWQMVFQNLNNYGQTTLNNLKAKLLELGDSVTENMNPADLQAYNDALKALNERLMDFNPKEALDKAKVDLGASKMDLANAKAAVEQAKALKEKAQNKAEEERATRALAAAEEWQKKAENDVAEAAERYNTAAEKMKSNVDKMVAPIQNLADELSSLGEQVDGLAGDILKAVGTVADATISCIQNFTNLATTSTKTMEGTSKAASAAISAVEKASVVLAIISAVLQVAQAIDNLIDKQKNEASEKQKEIARLQSAVNDYKMAVLEAQQAEEGWFNNSGLDNLQNSYEKGQQALENYYNTAYAMQDKYVDEEGGGILKKLGDWGSKLATLPAESVGKGLEAMGVEGAAAITKWADPFAAAAEKAINAVQDNSTDKDLFDNIKELAKDAEKVRAIDNLRIKTQEKKDGFLGIGSKNEKTQDLQSWLKENGFQGELFDENDMINLKEADMVLNNFGNKLTDQTKITIEELKEAREQYDQYIEDLRSYVSELFGGITDSMVDALFNWLETGEDVMDTFEKNAKQTFKAVAQDMTKTLINKMVMEKYSENIAKMYENYNAGDISAEELTKGIAAESASLKSRYEQALPVLKDAVQGMNEVLQFAGGEEGGQQSAVAGAFKTMSEDTAGVLEARFTAVYESNLAIHKAITDGVLQMVNSIQQNTNIASDAREILANSYLEQVAIREATQQIQKYCVSIADSVYNVEKNTSNL